ncbi:hypothetical protein BLNAU_8113 [Blattamonas nauphoetae]|uniref:Uncharacterized protein n=1 Tax=Blattamonas nauphoetae TaxID=2049346 RepID=A0ABQ9XZC2_9EUKA|nr:hypothetical protein BLNAU_8113 [Blattamonas nauphoetae]
MFPVSIEPSIGLHFGQNQDGQKTDQTEMISDEELMTLGKSIVDGTGDPFAILHTICSRFGITPKSIITNPREQSNPSLFIHLFSALFTYLPNSINFHLLPLFTTILQRHPPSLQHLLSSPLWLSLPTILASPHQSQQSPSTLQTQPQPSPQNESQIEEQSRLRPVLAFVNSILQLSLTSSPPTLIPNKTLLSSSLSTLSSHPDPLVSINSSSSLLCLNKLDDVEDETSMSVDELVAQRDVLRTQIGEKEQEISKMTEILKQKTEEISTNHLTINTLTTELHETQTETRKKDDSIRSKEQVINEKDRTITEKDALLKQKDERMAEMTRQLEGKDVILRKKDEDLRSASDTIHKKDALIIEKDAAIRMKDSSIGTLTKQAEERSTTLRKTEETLRQANETIRSKEEQNKVKDKQLQMKDETISELTKKLGEFVAMEKRLSDKLNTTHSKVVAVETQVTDAARDVKWIRGSVHPEKTFTIWDPTHFRKDGRRITSLVELDKSCFSDEITRGVWRLSIRCNKYDGQEFGVMDSSQLEQKKDSGIRYRQGQRETATLTR